MTSAFQRAPNWEILLHEYMEANRERHFQWGAHDCVMNYANMVIALGGCDIVPEYRGKYSTELGSKKALKKYGPGDLEAMLDEKMRVVEPAFLQRADAVWNGESVGICMGGYALFLADPKSENQSMIRVARTEWVKGWSPWAS